MQTFEWEGMPGHVSVETATFEDLGDGRSSSRPSLFHTTEERDGMLGSGMEGGMNETYERLDELLARLGGLTLARRRGRRGRRRQGSRRNSSAVHAGRKPRRA